MALSDFNLVFKKHFVITRHDLSGVSLIMISVDSGWNIRAS